MLKNTGFHKSKRAKQDEFYTQLTDIEKELRHYRDYFKDKVVYCNCDDPRVSNFFKYFSLNFGHLGLKKLISACYKSQDIELFSQKDSERAVYLEYEGDKNGNRMPDLEEIEIKQFNGDGDFRSRESIELLKEADIVVTNPPFSLFKEYLAQLMEYDKKFIIIGNYGSLTYNKIFPLIKENKMWLGVCGRIRNFINKASEITSINAVWLTNIDIPKRDEMLILYKKYTPLEYPEYDNYNAININKVNEIPIDYEGVMGVPITFLDKHNPEQFDVIGIDDEINRGLLSHLIKSGWTGKIDKGYMNGKRLYSRILIKNKRL